MKKIIVFLTMTALLVTALFVMIPASAAAIKVADFEVENWDINDGLKGLGFSVEKTNPISGTASYAFSANVTAATPTGNWGTGCLNGACYDGDWTSDSEDFLAFRVKNTDTNNPIEIALLVNVGGVYLPAKSAGIRMRDTEGNPVIVQKDATQVGGIASPFVVIPAGFDGTIYFPLKEESSFYNATEAGNATWMLADLGISQTPGAYNGKLLFDDIVLLDAADVPTLAPRLLEDFETPNKAASAYGALAPNSPLSVALNDDNNLQGTAFELSFAGEPATDSVYMQSGAFKGGNAWGTYETLVFIVENTDRENDVAISMILHNGEPSQYITNADGITLRDTNNYAVEAEQDGAGNLIIPAGFIGTVIIPLNEESKTVTEFRIQMTAVDGEFDGALLFDWFWLYNVADIPAANTPAPTATPTPVVTTPPTAAPSATTKPTTNPDTGAVSVVALAVAAVVSGGMIVLRKKED